MQSAALRVCAVAGAAIAGLGLVGCMEMVASQIENVTRPLARFDIRCQDPDAVSPLGGIPQTARKAYDGHTRTRDETAILVGHAMWRGRGTLNPTLWVVVPTSVDGAASVLEETKKGERRVQLPGRCGTPECTALSLLSGSHVVSVAAIPNGPKEGKRLAGSSRFIASAGGLYSMRVCLSGEQLLFWVRDETSLRCVSDLCPAQQESRATQPDDQTVAVPKAASASQGRCGSGPLLALLLRVPC